MQAATPPFPFPSSLPFCDERLRLETHAHFAWDDCLILSWLIQLEPGRFA